MPSTLNADSEPDFAEFEVQLRYRYKPTHVVKLDH